MTKNLHMSTSDILPTDFVRLRISEEVQNIFATTPEFRLKCLTQRQLPSFVVMLELKNSRNNTNSKNSTNEKLNFLNHC